MIRATFLLLATGLILGYATLRYGGVVTTDWNLCVLALGAVLILGCVPFGRGGVSAPVDPLLYAAVLAIPAWGLLQTVPLPFSWVSLLSPERAVLSQALLRFGSNPDWIPLSIKPEATLQYALRYLAFGATFLIARDLMWRMPGRQWMVAAPLLVIATLEALVGIVQDSAGVAGVVVSGTFVNRNHFSAMLEMCMPFAASAVFEFAPRGRRALAACAGAVGAAVLLAGITLSLSRAGFFIALISLFLLAWLHAMIRMRGAARALTTLGILLAVACAGILLASGGLLDRMAAPPSGEVALNDRFLFWKETLRVIEAYPIFGCGFGGFVSAVAPYRAAAVAKTLDYAHNDYLQYIAEGGAIALALAGIVGCLVARTLWRGAFAQPQGRRNGFALACAVALFAGLIHSGIDLITYVPATGMLLCWIAGMGAGLEFGETRR